MNNSPTNEQFRHKDLTSAIIGCFYDVYNELGFGFIESVYEKSLCIALQGKGLEAFRQIAIPVWFRGNQVGDFDADVMVNRLVLLELKTARAIEDAYLGQLMNYLKATDIEVGLLLNFGPKAEFKRVVLGNGRKLPHATTA